VLYPCLRLRLGLGTAVKGIGLNALDIGINAIKIEDALQGLSTVATLLIICHFACRPHERAQREQKHRVSYVNMW
jgi:hypothetical protein